MLHRHLNVEDFSLPAIDDIIERGERKEWAELGAAALKEASLYGDILQIAEARLARNPRAQRYIFWRNYAQKQLA